MATDPHATATARLRGLGQSLWLDNITRGLPTSWDTKDPNASDVLYLEAAPDTINTVPEDTLRAFADHDSCNKLMACLTSKRGALAQAGRSTGALS